MTEHTKQHSGGNGDGRGIENQTASADLEPERRLIFVQDFVQWERVRKRIVEQLTRYGFPMEDRMCISVALDESITFAIDQTVDNSYKSTAMLAYTLSNRSFHVRIKFGPGMNRTMRWRGAEYSDKNRWRLASVCMSGVRPRTEGNEVYMWKDNSRMVEQGANEAGRLRRILIAEEDGDVLARLEKVLRAEDYRVVTCNNGWDLVHHLGHYLAPERDRKEEFDVIVADVQLSGAGGLDVLKGLRNQGIPPVVLIVGSDELKRDQRSLRSAAAAVFERSTDEKEFLRVISTIVSADA